MPMRFFMLLMGLIGLGFASAAEAQARARSFEIQATLYDGPTLVGQPRIVAAENEEVILSVQREGGYRLRMTVMGRPEVGGNAATLQSHVQFFRQGMWEDVGAPTLQLGQDGTASIRIAASPATNNRAFRMDVKLRSVSLQAADDPRPS